MSVELRACEAECGVRRSAGVPNLAKQPLLLLSVAAVPGLKHI